MNNIKRSVSILLFVIFGSLAFANTGQKNEANYSSDIKVYYFHATRRCVTCEAVEAVARKAIRDNYGNEIDFIVVNREKEENKALVEKYKISGQTLLVVKGEKVENITNIAFMNARKKPAKVEELILSTVESLKE